MPNALETRIAKSLSSQLDKRTRALRRDAFTLTLQRNLLDQRLILSTIVIRYSILLRDLKTDTTHPPHSCPIFVPFKPPRPEMPTLATSAARRAGVQLWEIDLLEGVLADSNALQDSSAQKERTAKVKDWEPFLTPHSKPLVLKLSFE